MCSFESRTCVVGGHILHKSSLTDSSKPCLVLLCYSHVQPLPIQDLDHFHTRLSHKPQDAALQPPLVPQWDLKDACVVFPSPARSGAAGRTQQGQEESISNHGESSSTRDPAAQSSGALGQVPSRGDPTAQPQLPQVCPRFIPPLPCLASSSFCSSDREQALNLLLSCHWQGDKYPKITVDLHFTPLDHLPWLSTSLGNDTFPIPLTAPAPIRHNPTPQGCTEKRDGFSSKRRDFSPL